MTQTLGGQPLNPTSSTSGLGSAFRMVGQAVSGVAQRLVSVSAATVLSNYVPNEQTMIGLDTAPDVPVSARSIAGRLPAGLRVAVLLYPPRGILVLGALDARTDNLPTWRFDPTLIAGITSATPTLGAPVVGTSFIAPPSGVVTYSISADIEITVSAGGGYLIVYGEMRTGAVIGSGTVVSSGNAAFFEPRRLIGSVVARSQAGSANFPVSGLTAGNTYNISVWHYQTAGTGRISSRGCIVLPQI